MGNNSSTKNNKTTTELNDVHRKCVRTFCGNASESVDNFLQQLEGVKLLYGLSDELIMKLALEKIEGRALEWIHTKPGLMTFGVEHLKRALLGEFSPKKIMKNIAPSAPPRDDVYEDFRANPYPKVVNSEIFFNHEPIATPIPPPSYDTVMMSPATAPKLSLYPEISGIGTQFNSQHVPPKPDLTDSKHKKQPRKQTNNKPNVTSGSNGSKLETTPSLAETPKTDLLCDYCHKMGHKSDQCLLKATKVIKVPSNCDAKIIETKNCAYCKAAGHVIQECRKLKNKKENLKSNDSTSTLVKPLTELSITDVNSLETQGKKCYYCKSEGHLFRDCDKVPPCRKCGKKFHKTKECPVSNPEEAANTEKEPKDSIMKLLMDQAYSYFVSTETTSEITCKYCHASGHVLKNCEKLPPCRKCAKKGHKTQECPLSKTSSSLENAKKAIPYTVATPQDGFCHKCKKIGHHTVECSHVARIQASRIFSKSKK